MVVEAAVAEETLRPALPRWMQSRLSTAVMPANIILATPCRAMRAALLQTGRLSAIRLDRDISRPAANAFEQQLGRLGKGKSLSQNETWAVTTHRQHASDLATPYVSAQSESAAVERNFPIKSMA